jgi:hypothetical protein
MRQQHKNVIISNNNGTINMVSTVEDYAGHQDFVLHNKTLS